MFGGKKVHVCITPKKKKKKKKSKFNIEGCVKHMHTEDEITEQRAFCRLDSNHSHKHKTGRQEMEIVERAAGFFQCHARSVEARQHRCCSACCECVDCSTMCHFLPLSLSLSYFLFPLLVSLFFSFCCWIHQVIAEWRQNLFQDTVTNTHSEILRGKIDFLTDSCRKLILRGGEAALKARSIIE